MDLGIADKVALVTGATRGIGLAVARALAVEGAKVAVTYHSDAAGAKLVCAELAADQGRAITVPYALEDPDAAEQAIAQVTSTWGQVDIVVHCAVRYRPHSPGTHFEDVPVDDWDTRLATDLRAAIRLSQLAVGAMRPRAWGRLVLLSSHVVRNGRAGQEVYAAGKAALHGLVRSLTWDAASSGILANVVCPGLTATDGVLGQLPPHVREAEAALTPTGRLSDPADVASTIAFLCSRANRSITGSVLTVSGGR